MQIDICQQPWEHNFTQKKINQTLQLKVNKSEELRYVMIELFVLSKKHQVNLLLLQSYKEAPCYENNSSRKQIRFENADLYGKQQQKKYHYIILDQENKTEINQYLVILTNQTTSYKLVIKNLHSRPCPNNCTNNGICKDGICICKSGYLDGDCSEKGLLIPPFQQFKQKNIDQQFKYIYTQFNFTPGFKLSIKFSEQWQNKTDVRVQILISQQFNLPSNFNNTYDEIINVNKTLQYQIISNIDQIDNQRMQSVQNQSYFLVIKIISQKRAKCCLSIDFQELENIDDYEKIMKILLLFFLITLILFCFGIFGYICFRMKQQNENLYQSPNSDDLLNFKECPICLDNFEMDQLNSLIKLRCKHIFHSECLRIWRTYQITDNRLELICPCCRQLIE
ncbi:unnamed protein product [Paramecium sonneborni]|uniref:RING-type domain-containing protein n=1 Tax=Paramecium sonneborni TaxID=65129 RepID=A0A8S1R4F9_9CILI|nr:unnamed protein product [Paramecium sonneborni]